MEQEITPTALSRDGDAAIGISWSDGSTTRWTAAELRSQCPCATCRDQRAAKEKSATPAAPQALPVISAAEAQPLRIVSMRPVGSYAYNITFSDEHSSGIFTFGMLQRKPHAK